MGRLLKILIFISIDYASLRSRLERLFFCMYLPAQPCCVHHGAMSSQPALALEVTFSATSFCMTWKRHMTRFRLGDRTCYFY